MQKYHPAYAGLIVIVVAIVSWALGLWLVSLPRYGDQLHWVYPTLVIMALLTYAWYAATHVAEPALAATYAFFAGVMSGLVIALANLIQSFYAWELLRLLRDPIAGGLATGLAAAIFVIIRHQLIPKYASQRTHRDQS